MKSINPATGKLIKEYPEHSSDDAAQIIEQVNAAWPGWRRTSFDDRAGLMREAAETLRAREDEFARLMAEEMGKPVSQGRSEIEKCAWVCDYYADRAWRFLQPQEIETDAKKSYIAYQPLGIVLAVMPWNFPFWQVFRFAAPNLMAGNAGLLKHASNVSGCSLAIEEIFRSAGFPENIFRSILIPGKKTADALEHPQVRAATLTGSGPAGRKLAEKAGSLLKKTVLELGGSDPYLVLEDADVEEAAAICAKSRLINSGQSCIAAKRFIVLRSVYEPWLEKFTSEMNAAQPGDPLEKETQLGPQAREDLRDQLHKQVRKSIDAGAECLLGGEIPDRPGAWYPPTVLAGVKPGMPAFDEELFGPVAAVIRVETEAEAIDTANATSFGLGAAVFTRDTERGERIARESLQAGCCFVNSFVKSDPRLPFGGIKESGYGRELGRLGIREFVNAKTVWMA